MSPARLVEPLQAPWTSAPNGAPRRIGVELEIEGSSTRKTACLVQELRGGGVIEQDPFRFQVAGTALGDITVELDLRLAHPPEHGAVRPAQRLAARAIGMVAGLLAPVELVFPPLPPARLPEIDDLVREIVARRPHLRPAGPHLNPELASFEPSYVTDHLRAFSLLAPRLRATMGVPPPRRFGFVTAFPPPYRLLISDPGYHPDLDRLVEDYLAFNPTRYRELDMLPLFTLLAPDRVRGRVRLHKIKPRPVFHWRQPGSRPYQSVVADWNRWVGIERLAAEPERLSAAQALDHPLPGASPTEGNPT